MDSAKFDTSLGSLVIGDCKQWSIRNRNGTSYNTPYGGRPRTAGVARPTERVKLTRPVKDDLDFRKNLGIIKVSDDRETPLRPASAAANWRKLPSSRSPSPQSIARPSTADAVVNFNDPILPLPIMHKPSTDGQLARAFVGVSPTKCFQEKKNIPNSKLEYLKSWRASFDVESASFNSIALQCEAKLQEIESDYGMPSKEGLHPFKTAVCCELLDKVVGVHGRYSELMQKLKLHLFQAIYPDYQESDGVDAMFQKTPFYVQTQRQEELRQKYENQIRENTEEISDMRRKLVHAQMSKDKYRVRWNNCRIELVIKTTENRRQEDDFAEERKRLQEEVARLRTLETNTDAKARSLALQVTNFQKQVAQMVDRRTYEEALEQLVLSQQQVVTQRDATLQILKRWRREQPLPQHALVAEDTSVACLCKEGESLGDVQHLSAQDLTFRWANFILFQASSEPVRDFSTDWVTLTPYVGILHIIASDSSFTPEERALWASSDVHQQATAIVAAVKKIVQHDFLTERDLLTPTATSTCLVLALLMSARPNMPGTTGYGLEREQLETQLMALEYSHEEVYSLNKADDKIVSIEDIMAEVTAPRTTDFNKSISSLADESSTTSKLVLATIESEAAAEVAWVEVNSTLLAFCIETLRTGFGQTHEAAGKTKHHGHTKNHHKRRDSATGQHHD